MNKLKKCKGCNIYTLRNKCPKCNKISSAAHYKFIKVKNKSD